MATSNGTTTEINEEKRQALSPADMAAGLQHEREIAVAQAVAQAKIDAQQAFIGQLYERYQVDPETYKLISWLAGFVPIQAGDSEGD
jgi:hypothetical protein